MEENLTLDFGDKKSLVRAKISILPDGGFDIIDVWKEPYKEEPDKKTSETHVIDLK